MIQHIVNAERYFWECVEKDTPPEADASESAAKALQLLYPEHVPLSTTDLSEDEQANQQFEQLIRVRNQVEKHQSNSIYSSISYKPRCKRLNEPPLKQVQ